MIRTLSYLGASTLVLAFAVWAYTVNYATQEAVRRVADLNRAIAEERAAIAMLRAEWAYLNRPERLRRLAEAHFAELRLMPMTAANFGAPGLVTFPPQPEPAPINDADLVSALIASLEVAR